MEPSSSSNDRSIKSKPKSKCTPQPPYYGFIDINDPDDPIMTQEELEAYFREVDASEGFDVETIPCSLLCGAITPIRDINRCFTEEIQHGAKEAIKDYNQKNNTNFEVVEIEKANVGGSCGIGLYITFKVKPSGTPAEYPTTTFQAQVLDCTAGYFIEVCRIKPSN